MKKTVSALLMLLILVISGCQDNVPEDSSPAHPIRSSELAREVANNVNATALDIIPSETVTYTDFRLDGLTGFTLLNGEVEYAFTSNPPYYDYSKIATGVEAVFSDYSDSISDLVITDGSFVINLQEILNGGLLYYASSVQGTVGITGTINDTRVEDIIILDYQNNNGSITCTLETSEAVIFTFSE
ncbi:MAG: hypothetical protein JW874_08485 [Spirochaetales bacterium]|nr:hypothetical protein [Spirochaetales bacterium]